MIARCRAKCWIVQLKEENQSVVTPDSQRGMKGHIIIYPQRPSEIANLLPPSKQEILTPVCVLFVGSTPPTAQWLHEKAKPLCVRREKVRAALKWLKINNPLYQDVSINESLLNEFEDTEILPFHVEHIVSSDASEALTSRYDTCDSINFQPDFNLSENEIEIDNNNNTLPFESVVITDISGQASPNEMRAAALRHVKSGGGYIQVPHDPKPVNEFFNVELFPMIYPTLFPYGIGGFEDRRRSVAVSLKRHVKHLFNLKDKRFQEHYSFLFTVFNILQRRSVLLHTSLKVHKNNFENVAKNFASVSPETIHIVTERVSRGDSATANNSDERKVLNLMKQVNTVTSNVPGTSASRVAMRNEIRALMMEKGLPSFFITINPADIYNPLVKFLGGADIDIDNLLPEEIPNYWEQSILIAKNPFVAAKFFNIYIKAFINTILAFNPNKSKLEDGILGVVNAYYGCVEAQGRGTLHCHMIVWLEGSLNPNEIKNRIIDQGDSEFCKRLISFLDDTISNSIPHDPDPNLTIPSSQHHPCSVRGFDITGDVTSNLNGEDISKLQEKDLYNLVKSCQVHRHSKTCYKYWKGPPEPKECRFNLNENNTCEKSTFNMNTGELCLRCLDGLVNNFNETILRAIRCNMDIKFIGSGPAAKAIIYYITNYITKSQLKTHVAYAALELATKKLGEYNPDDDEITIRAKKLLQKCAFSMISHQELSAQQVASYLMDYEDHFTSHQYRNLYWTSFEKHINQEQPSPECYSTDLDNSLLAENESGHESELEITSENNVNRTNNNISDSDIDLDLDRSDENGNLMNFDAELDESNEELSISVNSSGELIARTTQVVDYQLRDHRLQNTSLWDFISSLEKSPKSRYKGNNSCTNPAEEFEDDNEQSEANIHVSEKKSDITIVEDPPNRRRKEIYYFQAQHSESATHCLSFRMNKEKTITVPIGPSIPRRDQAKNYARYCRLMLILFKPWRHASDLRENDQKWEEAFGIFQEACSVRITRILDNMQILHECQDSGNDHFSQRRHRGHNSQKKQNPWQSNEHVDSTDDFGPVDESIILEHLESITASTSEKISRSKSSVDECLLYANMSGMFDVMPNIEISGTSNANINDKIKEVHQGDVGMEEIWKKEYENRRDQWKRKTIVNSDNSSSLQPGHHNIGEQMMSDGSDFRQAINISDQPVLNSTISQSICIPDCTQAENNIDIDEMINEFTLNTEQARAFKIICEHSMHHQKEPLKMYIGGAGGTGKSRVINALKEFFLRKGQGRRFRLASYTGVAAKNISGMTVHAALSLNQQKKANKGNTRRDLTAMWEGVDFFFIDEISMIGCQMLYRISEALIEAKGNSQPFGGVNFIVAGDFAQLPPVGETRLYASVNTSQTQKATKRGQEVTFGKLLWLSISTVIILTESMRQVGHENLHLVQTLSRLREGKCNDADFQLLSNRVIQNVNNINWNDWKDAPLIVSENAQKDAINELAAHAFARRTNQTLHWYYAIDQHQQNVVSDEALKRHLQNLNSGVTNQRLGKIPLVIGMPVMISQNYDVEGGIVNGCTGILKEIRYQTDSEGNRYATSCVVESESITGKQLPMLPPKHAAIIQDTTDLNFIHPHSGKRCKIKRTQLPILPAFAMTAHKAQGQTLKKVIIDLDNCRGTESPYVMVSRVTSLEGLLILRPFRSSKIKCRQSEDVRNEFKRLDRLRTLTINKLEGSEQTPIQTNTIPIDSNHQTQNKRINLSSHLTCNIDNINTSQMNHMELTPQEHSSNPKKRQLNEPKINSQNKRQRTKLC